jgi:PAS domain S-box-containing protein
MEPITPAEKTLRSRLAELEENLRDLREHESLAKAIQADEVDAVIVLKDGPKINRIHSDEPLYRVIVEEMAHGVATVLPDGTIVYANRHLATTLGLEGSAILGRNIVTHVAESDQAMVLVMLREAMQSRQEIQVAMCVPDGHCPVLLSGMRLPVDGTDAIALTIVDLTDQIERQSAEESSRAKDELLASVSHELRTPLTSMMGWVQLLQLELAGNDEVSTGLRNLKSAVLAEMRIVDDLLDLSRSERGSLTIATRECDLRDVLDSTVSFVMLIADNKSVSLTLAIPDGPLPVRGDPDRLRQVFVNLLTNALKFTDANGSVAVTVERGDQEFRVDVVDTGIGILSDFLPFVFEPFRRSERAQRYPGLGIGLAITKRLIEAHGGSITASSEGAGLGAKFSVRLPAIPH